MTTAFSIHIDSARAGAATAHRVVAERAGRIVALASWRADADAADDPWVTLTLVEPEIDSWHLAPWLLWYARTTAHLQRRAPGAMPRTTFRRSRGRATLN